MSEDPFLNPINPDKVAENPGLLPYAHTAGGAVIKPDDMGKVKGRSVLAMRQQTDRQMNQLYEQMEVLARQAKLLADRKEISERIYDAAMGFEPIISETYYLYEKEDGSDLMSLVAFFNCAMILPIVRAISGILSEPKSINAIKMMKINSPPPIPNIS